MRATTFGGPIGTTVPQTQATASLAHRVVRNEALAEEITQEAFLQVWSTGTTLQTALSPALDPRIFRHGYNATSPKPRRENH